MTEDQLFDMRFADERFYGLHGESVDYDAAAACYSNMLDFMEDGPPRALLMYALCLERGGGWNRYPDYHMKFVKKAAAAGDEYAKKWLETGKSVVPPTPDYDYTEIDSNYKAAIEMAAQYRTDHPEIDWEAEDAAREALTEEDQNADDYDEEHEFSRAEEYIRDGQSEEAFEVFYGMAALHGSAAGAYELSVAYLNGAGTEKNDLEVLRWLDISAERGFAPAAKALRDLPGDFKAEAAYHLGYDFYKEIDGTPTDYPTAAYWFEMAVGAGSLPAMYMLGNMYALGRGVEQSYDKAIALYQKGAELGDGDCAERLIFTQTQDKAERALEYIKAKEYAKALPLYKEVAEAGRPEAMLAVGHLYATGKGVPRDKDMARYWYGRVIESGDEEAAKIAAGDLREMDEEWLRTAVCPWCGEEAVFEVTLKKGDLLWHDTGCGNRFRYVDRYQSRKYGMEKCAPQPGVPADYACPNCGGRLKKAVSSLKEDDDVECTSCYKEPNPFWLFDNNVFRGNFNYLGGGNFARYIVVVCEHCKKQGLALMPQDMAKDECTATCRGCGREFGYDRYGNIEDELEV